MRLLGICGLSGEEEYIHTREFLFQTTEGEVIRTDDDGSWFEEISQDASSDDRVLQDSERVGWLDGWMAGWLGIELFEVFFLQAFQDSLGYKKPKYTMDRDEILRGDLQYECDLIAREYRLPRDDTYDISYFHTFWSGLTATHYDPVLCGAAHRDLDETTRYDLSVQILPHAIRQRMDTDRVLRWDDIDVGDRK